MGASDVLVDFEGYYRDYTIWQPPAWSLRYSPARFWHIIHDAGTPAEMQNAIRLSRLHRAGHVYVTEQGQDPRPPEAYLYDRLPPDAYWTAELDEVRATAFRTRGWSRQEG
jgi:hypothetical protein